MHIRAALRQSAQWATDLLYPPRCVGCGRFGLLVCEPCRGRLAAPLPSERCDWCSALWEGEEHCPRCFHWDALDGAICAYEMAGLARILVHHLKYRGVRQMAPMMAGGMAPLIRDRAFDGFVAVPLHRSRERWRGFNQSELLVQALGIESMAGLERIRKTRQQVGLGAEARRTNMGGAFGWQGPRLDGLRIAVVDDVVTTGMTVNECARVLKDYGAKEVVALAFARASYEADAGPGNRDW